MDPYEKKERQMRLLYAGRWMVNNPRSLINLLVILERHDGQLSTNKLLRLMGSHEYHLILKLAEQLGLITREKVPDKILSVRGQPRTSRFEWQLLAQLGKNDDFDSEPFFSFKQARKPVDQWDTSTLMNKLTPLGRQLAKQAKESSILAVTRTGRYRP
jgi:hypothetical protein